MFTVEDHLFLLLFLLPIIQAKQPCLLSNMCGRKSIPIRFPFQLRHEDQYQEGQNNSCGYPGFNLGCNTQGKTVLRLPYSGDFFVRMIDYEMQMIKLYDPDNCLPRRLLQFNLSGSPFVPAFSHEYTFFSCPSHSTKPGFIAMDCLSNSTTSFFATPSLSTLANSPSPTCKILTTLQVPVTEQDLFYDGFSADLNEDLQLTWSLPDCGKCEEQGFFCGFKNNTSQETGCLSSALKSGGLFNDLRVFRIICFSIFLPVMTCVIGVACFSCFTDRGRRNNTTTAGRSNSSQGVVAVVSAQPTIVVMGLDESTIQSYEKLVLGESRRLPGPNDGTCSICLSEYCNKDILRCIPDCKHCFHADCIDEWLRMNSTCPVCRNSPSPAHDHATSNNV
ncbi:putative RING-H2 finger protein ATL21A [Juglans microcarpa x Juglans regia]|uniref:putative RING-H2 finger protein ATL21A n=1 Tax=Juglans microcarpa x Juglans regia TaxID=2249226 RepID=UPI001B7F39BC|nr:putative RING-H2 finger protein ATL21A [Juglans microcarpa x Juglans regia]